jgi:hypothetical protein
VRIVTGGLVAAGAAALGFMASAQAMPVHVQSRLAVRQNVHLRFSAPKLPDGGYYYAVAVLRPYKTYTRRSPPCSTSSNMQRTDYGYPQPDGVVALTLAPAKSTTGHWCRGGAYDGAIYAVPHAPPCESTYPCASEPYKPPSPCWHSGGQLVCGVVALRTWAYPDPLPAPLASGTAVVGRFSMKFPAR